VCLAILEYYAFEAGANCRQAAHDNFRLLAGHALREFIYKEVGYDPAHAKIEFWRQFHDRVSLTYDATPTGYFSVFKEISHIIVTIGQAGAKIDDKFVPDVSVGQHWARYWDENSLDKKYGVSRRYHHTYPNYFPQAASNPQPARCYPESALGEFRAWLRENYIGGGKLQNYLKDQVKQKKISPSFAQLAVSACSKKGGKEITTEKR
jgi:hypothetical protein